MANKFIPMGLGKYKNMKKMKGKGIIDSIKKGVKKVQNLKLAQKGLDAIQNNKLIRDTLQKTGILRPLTQVLVKGREYGFGKRKTMKKGKGFFGDIYKGVKSGVSKVLGVSDKLKKLGIARNLNKVVPYAQKAAMFIPKYGPGISAGIEAAKKPIQYLADKGYGKRIKGGMKFGSYVPLKQKSLSGLQDQSLGYLSQVPFAKDAKIMMDIKSKFN